MIIFERNYSQIGFGNYCILSSEKNLPRLTHIHGTADKVLPNYKSADILIEKGGHFMVVNEAERVSFELRKLILE